MGTKVVSADLKGLAVEERYGIYEVWSDDSRAIVVNITANMVVKRFRGESAWSNADRHASDLYFALRNAQKGL